MIKNKRKSSEIEFSVAICTLDRKKYLMKAVDAVLKQIVSFPKGILIVVNNGSSDGTEEYLNNLTKTRKNIIIVSENRRGLYYARARAIDLVHGEFLIFLDDDAVPQLGWLEGMLNELMTAPDIGAVGCAVDPLWEEPRPKWLSEKFAESLPITLKSHDGRETYFPCFPAGISIGFRVNECLKLYVGSERRTDYPLGRTETESNFSCNALMGGEDTDICEIYARNNFRVLFINHARVWHHITKQRVEKAWFYRKYLGDGYSRIRLLRLAGYHAFGRHGIKMLIGVFIFLPLNIIRYMLPEKISVIIRAYYLKCFGAWRELLFNPKVKPLPYICSS